MSCLQSESSQKSVCIIIFFCYLYICVSLCIVYSIQGKELKNSVTMSMPMTDSFILKGKYIYWLTDLVSKRKNVSFNLFTNVKI